MSDRCPPCPPSNVNPFMIAAAAVGVAKIINETSNHSLGPISGYQYTQAGTQYMDETMDLIRQKRDGNQQYVMKASDREVFLDEHETLQPEQFRLQAETRSYMGSFKNMNTGRKFYNRTYSMAHDAKTSSGREMAIYERAQAQAELRNYSSTERDEMSNSAMQSPIRHDSESSFSSRSTGFPSRSNMSNSTTQSRNDLSYEDQEESEEDNITTDSRSSQDRRYKARGSVNSRSTGHPSRSSQDPQDPEYRSTGQTHHRAQPLPLPKGAQPAHMYAQPLNHSGYPQAGSSSDFSPYAATNASSGFPAGGYPPTRPH